MTKINYQALREASERAIGGVTHWMPLPEPPQEVK
ncbi:DUF551 domain-containing protein [Escherichia coli]|nr:DUF551 domain-containing protein [Escherichia coli]